MTSRDVAERAGVSQATVSRVLNGNYPVAAETRARVMAALEATGYVLNAQAKAMRTSQSGSIGLVASEIQNPYFPYLLDELTRAASKFNVHSIVWNDDSGDVAIATAGLASGTVDGLIFTTAREGMAGIDALIARGAPIVLCNRAPLDSAADVVMNDHEGSGRGSADYLLGQGRTRIAAIFGSPDTFATPLRERGFMAALKDAGVSIPPQLVQRGRTGYETGRDAALRLLDSGTPFDSLFCSSDVIAFGAIDALRSRGVRIPEDVWVAGIDGLRISSWGAYDLTTHQQNVSEIARRAVGRLLDRVAGESDHVLDLIPAHLTIRGSTAHAGA
jgi:LacI family transcriptional regulator